MRAISTKGMSREEWLEQRTNGIGGSDLAAVCGVSRWKTPLDVWLEKTGKGIPTQDNKYLEAGRRLESAVAQWYADQTGRKVIFDHKIRRHRRYHFLIGDFDRIIVANPPEYSTGILEVKTASHQMFDEWKEGNIPLEYMLQIQHYMFVSGHRWGSFAVLGGGVDFLYIDLNYSPDFILPYERQAVKFWREHVLKDIPPDPMTRKDVERLYPKAEGGVIEANTLIYDTWERYQALADEKAQIEAEMENIKTQFAILMKDAKEVRFGERVLATYNETESETFDKARLKEENSFIYNRYAKKINRRTLRIKRRR